MPEHEPQPAGEREERPSKSARKREMHALQALGEQLCALSPRELESIPLSDAALAEAVAEARRISSHSARRRHLQLIGKLMRQVDAEPIREALAALEHGRQASAQHFQALEAWRDRLLHEGDAALPAVLERWPQADRQHLRQLLRHYAREQSRGQPPAAARSLFRYLRSLPAAEPDGGDESSGAAAPSTD